MDDHGTHAADAADHGDSHAGGAGHGSGHDAGHGAEHGHEGMGLGPVDVRLYAVGILGVAIGVIGALCFAISTGRFG